MGGEDSSGMFISIESNLPPARNSKAVACQRQPDDAHRSLSMNRGKWPHKQSAPES